MEGAGSGSFMAFGESGHGHVHGFYPMLTTTHLSADRSNTLFLPPSMSQDLANRHGGLIGGGSSFMMPEQHQNYSNVDTNTGYFFMETGNDAGSNSVKAKIVAHPYYHRLLEAYINCQKIGAPAEVATKLEEAFAAAAAFGRRGTGYVGEDPALDQFMEAYCEMLTKYEEELSKPFKEAMDFLSRIERQFKSVTLSPLDPEYGNRVDKTSWNEDDDVNHANDSSIDPLAEDLELKGQLLRKYSGYLGSLKQEFMKKRKKGKLPKEARQQLLDWWSRHYKWPYPSVHM